MDGHAVMQMAIIRFQMLASRYAASTIATGREGMAMATEVSFIRILSQMPPKYAEISPTPVPNTVMTREETMPMVRETLAP